MANTEQEELKSSLCEENEADQSLTELATNTQAFEGNQEEIKSNYFQIPAH